MIKRIKDFYNYKDNRFYFSLFGPLAMGIIHLISVIIHYDSIALSYCIFSFLIALFLVWQWAIEKYKIKPNNYIAAIISILLILTPMMMSFILTILYRDAPTYLFDWVIYAYALYGTVKMVFAIKRLIKKEKTEKEYALSLLGLLSALYTIQMMEFRLIKFASDGTNDQSMYLMQLFTQGAIFIASIVFIILLILKNKRRIKDSTIK